MEKSAGNPPKILITGGTSGLGLELVKLFLKKGYEVIATGRKHVRPEVFEDQLMFYQVDFSDLNQTATVIKEIARHHSFDIVINNAGILSPPDFILTKDGLEYTFQVNFLSHLLLNEIILRSKPAADPMTTVAVTSMVYRIGGTDLQYIADRKAYKPYKAYSDSKLFLSLMCRHLSEKYPRPGHEFIGFEPGVFSSGIFRMQRKWFRGMYMIAAPFMRDPFRVAGRLSEIIDGKNLINGSVYDYRKRTKSVPDAGIQATDRFWEECYMLIEPFIGCHIPDQRSLAFKF